MFNRFAAPIILYAIAFLASAILQGRIRAVPYLIALYGFIWGLVNCHPHSRARMKELEREIDKD